MKGVLDSLVSCGLMLDMRQIDDLRVIRCDKVKGGKNQREVVGVGVTQQEHKHYCLLKYIALLDKQKKRG